MLKQKSGPIFCCFSPAAADDEAKLLDAITIETKTRKNSICVFYQNLQIRLLWLGWNPGLVVANDPPAFGHLSSILKLTLIDEIVAFFDVTASGPTWSGLSTLPMDVNQSIAPDFGLDFISSRFFRLLKKSNQINVSWWPHQPLWLCRTWSKGRKFSYLDPQHFDEAASATLLAPWDFVFDRYNSVVEERQSKWTTFVESGQGARQCVDCKIRSLIHHFLSVRKMSDKRHQSATLHAAHLTPK